MRSALIIAEKDLRQRIRDRSAFVVAILVPLGLSFILNAALGGTDEESVLQHRYGVVDLDGGAAAEAFVTAIAEAGFGRIVEVPSLGQARRRVDAGEVAAAFVIPESFTADVQGSRPAQVQVIGSPDAPIGMQIARSVATSYASELNAVRLSVATVTEGEPPEAAELAALVERARETDAAAAVDERVTASRSFSSTTFFAAGMAVFFLFFTVEFGVRSLILERQDGTLARLLAAPLSPGSIIAGKALASFVMGLASMVVLVAATTFLMGAEWGDPLGVGLLVVAGVTAAMGITALVSTLAKTPEQAANYTAMVAVVLGLLGGTFFPISQGGGLLANLSLISPHAWLMRGFGELSGGGGGAGDVLRLVAVVLAFGIVTSLLALVRARRSMVRT
jgi:ABC-2 type transport system permease protein